VVARLVDRGNAAATTVDFGAMEIYGGSCVVTDPYRVAAALRTAHYE
jgi:hypothetical protein